MADLPSPDRLVLVAVLDDSSTANLGTARYYPASGVYRMADGALEVHKSARGADGVFSTDSGRYRVLTQQEHAALKRDEAARATRAAVASIAPPVATTDTTLRASTSLSALKISPAPTGCSANSKMATVIAIGPVHIELGLARIQPLIDIARSNNNYVTVVVTGVANDTEAEAALRVPTPRLFLAGAAELEALRSRKAVGPRRVYLREAVLVGLVRGSSKGYDQDGANGVWCLPASPVPLDGSLTTLEPRGDRTMVQWHLALNAQWRDWYARYDKQSMTLDAHDNALWGEYTSFPVVPRRPPVAHLPRWSSALLSADDGPVFGTVDHTIWWRAGRSAAELWPCPCECWASTPPGLITSSPYWAVASWCHNTQGALRTPPPALDVQLTLDDLQYDVWTTLATLAMHTHNGAEGSPSCRVRQLRGTLGPVVLAGRVDNEPMRTSWWVADESTPVLMLMPEAYVRTVLSDYNSKRTARQGQPLMCAQGFLALANADEILVNFVGLTASELDSERAAFGPRLWTIRGTPIGSALLDLRNTPSPSNGLVSYRTQTDADAEWARGMLNPGARVGTSPTHSVYYTNTTSDDQLSGLRVRWTVEDRPTLDVDTFEGGEQISYERFR